MSHGRKNIRDAVVTILSGNTDAGTNVFANRETALWESELPAIMVYVKEESADPRDLSGRQSIRNIQLQIVIKAEANDTVDDDLDDLAEDVEDLMSANPTLSAAAISSIYKSTEITLDAESEIEKGVAVLIYEVKYIQ